MWRSKLKSKFQIELIPFFLLSVLVTLTTGPSSVGAKMLAGTGFQDDDRMNLTVLSPSALPPFKPRSDLGGTGVGYGGLSSGYGGFGNGWSPSTGYPTKTYSKYQSLLSKGSGWKRQAIVDYDDDDSVADVNFGDLGLLGLLGLMGLPGITGLTGLKGLKAAGLLTLPLLPLLFLLPFAPFLLLALLLFIPVPIVTTGRGSPSGNAKPMVVKDVLKETLDDLMARLPSDLTKLNFDFLKKKKGKQ